MKKETILIVDDISENIHVLMNILKYKYQIQVATSGVKAIDMAVKNLPDLILLDIMMPEVNGYAVLEALKLEPSTANIPVIFVSAMGEVTDETKGLALGAVDYITKPVIAELVLSRVNTHLALKKHTDHLDELVKDRTEQLKRNKDAILLVMGLVAEYRDLETGDHLQRTSRYVRVMTESLLSHAQFKDQLTEEHVEMFSNAAPLHDIGKVAIADRILLKEGKLTKEEFEIMKQHAVVGEQTIAEAQLYLDDPALLDTAKEIAGSHHEKWDGSGYPRGLKGNNIPLSARIMMFADVYDALISKRSYKRAFAHQKACDVIKQNVGTHFDPVLYDVFFSLQNEFKEIAEKFGLTREAFKPALF